MLQQLRATYELGPHDAETAPLGEADDPDGLTLLAGRFREARVGDVRRDIEQGGGEVVADVDEGWTVPRRSPPRRGGGSRELDGRATAATRRPGGQRAAHAMTQRSW